MGDWTRLLCADSFYGLQRDLREKLEMMKPVEFRVFVHIFGEYLDKRMVWGLMVKDAAFILHMRSTLQ